ncbi:MAG TPA: histidine--tRNA ligase, partial [Candidatus Brocadiia bacterium]|nr:histidine--tRNA ligase [Candidatus Brocadiia bacterium]
PDLPKPFKRYQVAPVWRAEKPGQGRFREFVQCDVDIVGTASLAADAECVQVDSAVMDALGVPDVQIRVNNRRILEGLSTLAGGADANRMKAVFRAIDKLDKQGPDTVRELLVSQDGLTPDQAARVLAFVSITGSNAERLAQARELMAGVETAQKGLDELQTVLDLAAAGGVPADRVQVDLSIARGLDYYTGTVFETFLLGLPGFGSVMSGGRYDGLISLFIGKDMPAVGISVGLDRLLAGLIELKRVEAPKSVVEVYVAVFDEETRPAALALAARLRAAGLRVEVSYEAGKIGKQFKHADRLGARVALVIGPEELAQNAVALKDLRAGAQAVVPLDGIEAKVRQALC